MSRIIGMEVPNEGTHKCWRLKPIHGDYDHAEHTGTWDVPSSNPRKAYVCSVDFDSGECACGCKCFKTRTGRDSRMHPAKGRDLEHMAREEGYDPMPLITRHRSAMCRHLELVQRWLRRHDLIPYFLNLEADLLKDPFRRNEAFDTRLPDDYLEAFANGRGDYSYNF